MAPPNIQELFAVQSKLRTERKLERIPVRRCKTYKPNGLKSYVYLLHRFQITPTQPGPYFCEDKQCVEQRGLAGSGAALGGRARLVRTHNLLKENVADGKPGQVPAEDQQWDSMYLCPVQIGTPPQTLMLDFDTGSADLWVFSTELPANLQKGHTCFDPSKSSTYKDLKGLQWSITYGDRSSASGNCGADTVGLGGLLVENQCVELAVKLSTQFAQGEGDGLLGLAFSSINTVTANGQHDPQPTVVENMISQKDIPPEAELFTSAFYSGRDDGKDSFFTFGWIDQSLVDASGTDIKWTPIDSSSGFWMFPSTSYTVNGTEYQQANNTAIADTGTTLALVADEVCTNLYAAVPGAKYDQQQQGWVFPINTAVTDLPKFTLAVGEYQFEIQPEDLAFAPVDNNWWYGAVQSRGDNSFDILGDAFLKSIYAIWDQGNLRFGAVPKIEKVQNLTPPTGSETTA